MVLKLMMFLPPCPSKTPNKEFPFPMSNSQIAASYIFRLQPLLSRKLPCISQNENFNLVFKLSSRLVLFYVLG